MVGLLALVLPRVVSEQESLVARSRLVESEPKRAGPHEAHAMPGELAPRPWRERVRTLAGWSDAAAYTISDLTMLRRELVIGFLVAGFADVAVPLSFWKSLFLGGHGLGTSLENAVLGPFLAIISFVCSIGNVPLAAALWSGGISFGGVVAFVFGDLITLPLLLIYRKYYGTRLTAKLLGAFWAIMSVSGFAVGELFDAVGLVPLQRTARRGTVGQHAFAWNYTTVLDIVALACFAAIYLLYRNRDRVGGGTGYAKDPVCGMQVEVAHAPAVAEHLGRTVYFCSDHCQHRFLADPDRFAPVDPARDGDGHGDDRGVGEARGHGAHEHAANGHEAHTPEAHENEEHGRGEHEQRAVDPVCGMRVDPANAAASAEHGGTRYFFCNPGCRDAFLVEPERFIASTIDT
jgi:hypothetical protein